VKETLTVQHRDIKERKAVNAQVRRFEVGDLDQVLGLAERYASWDATPTKADIEGFHSVSPEFFFVAEVKKKIVGFVCGRESSPPAETLDKWKSRKVASIETLAVDEDYRRQGIATSLLGTLLDAFRQKQTDVVTLSVPAVEVSAMKLYEKMGFEARAHFLWKRLSA
jgi:[ribosomal protein S18]-alanine N-acetyltransferase